ncbi:MAG: pseudaminic acid cytidylyltransferase [Pseudomonadota bacterium]
MKLCVIPARGGSKRIPRKNIRSFGGRPMIGWSIAAAHEAGCFDRIIVSTDDEDIAQVARDLGAEVPFLRPATLSDDFTGTGPVTAHALGEAEKAGGTFDAVCCLYATAPFVRADDLRASLAKFKAQPCDYVFSVTTFAFPPARALRLKARDRVEMLQPAQEQTRSQDLDEVVHDAGQFYWGTAEAWHAGRPIFSSDSVAYMLPRHLVQDIDTEADWTRAEWMRKAMDAADGAG